MPEWLGSSAELLWTGLKAIGVFLYAFFASGSGNALIGTLVGAGISAFVSYKLAVRATNLDRQKRDEDRAEKRRANGYSLILKIIRMTTFAKGMHDHMEECRGRAREHGDVNLNWSYVTPLGNLPDKIRLETDEVTTVMYLKDDTLLNQILNLEALHNSIVDGMALYERVRREATRDLPARMRGRVGESTFSEEEMLKLGPKFAEVDSAIEPLEGFTVSFWALSQKVLSRAMPQLREKLGITTHVNIIRD